MWRGGGRRLTLQRDLCSMSGGADLARTVSPAIGKDADGAGAMGGRHDGRGRLQSVASSEGSAREGSRSATRRDGVHRLRARALGRSVSPATTSSAVRWRAFMTHRLPDIMTTEGMSSNDAMSRVAAEWMESKEDDSQLLLLAEAGIKDPCAPAGSEDGTPTAGRKRRLRSASPHRPRYKRFAPRKQRSRSLEMHECLVNASQEMQQDKVLFQSLRGAELRKLDPRHKTEGRYLTLKHKAAPTAEAQQQSTRSNDKRGVVDVEDADDEDNEGDEGGERGEWLKLSGQGMSLSEMESIEAWMQETAAESAARAVGVGREHASTVLGAYQQTCHVPPAEETGDGRGGKRDTIKTSRGRRFSKAHIFAFRSWVIDQALIGDNIHHRNIAVELERIAGAAPTRRAIRRLRGILGICRGKVVGANSAKTSRRVRLARYRFVKRRMEEDRRADPGMRPIRVYSDETYAHANTNVGETWVLEEKAWRETVIRRAEEAIERGEEAPTVSSLAGMKGHAPRTYTRSRRAAGGAR
jgi:hypothetical protein